MLRHVVLALVSVTAFALPTLAQSYPDGPVTVIVPTNPGGSIDITARVSMQALEKLWEQPVVIENRPGGSMIIGTETVKSARPDGYTFLVTHDGTVAMNPYVFPDLPYDPQTDLTPIALLTQIPGAILVHPDSPINSVEELMEAAKANPGSLNHAFGGSATLLWSELFKAMADVDYNDVPYQGAAQALNSLAISETQLVFADLASADAALKANRVRLLAVTSLERSPAFPDVPTVNETVAGYEAQTWMGMFGPAGIPEEIAAKASADVGTALQTDEVKAGLERLSMIVRGQGGAQELRTVLAEDLEKWGGLIKQENITFGQ